VLHIFGPGGIGKSSLLREYLALARQVGRQAALLDGRELEPSPAGFYQALSQALGLRPAVSPAAFLIEAQNPVLLLDTYEIMAPLDGWLRESFLPQLPAEALVVLAGRNPPGMPWRSEGDWSDVSRIVSLRNLRPDESLAFLAVRGVPLRQHPSILSFTHGHPLALSLVADVVTQTAGQGPQVDFQPDQIPHVVAMLLERFIGEVPSQQHRLALHACAIVRALNESILRAALEQPDVSEIFAWLRQLSFIESGPRGLFPHDLAREVLDNDLRWRDPESYRALHDRVRGAIRRQMMAAEGTDQLRNLYDLVYLHRHNPLLQPYFQWQELGQYYVEPLLPAEHGRILPRMADWAAGGPVDLSPYWLERQPQAWHVVRDSGGEVAGVFVYLALHLTTDDDRQRDLGVAAAWDYMQTQAPLRPGDEAFLARIYASPQAYSQPSAVMNTAQLAITLRWLASPRLAWSFNQLDRPDFWQSIMSYCNFQRVRDARADLYAHDWRAVPAAAWLELLGSRELSTDPRIGELTAAASPPLLVLSQPDFAQAVKDALRDFHSPGSLGANPLTRSRLLASPPSAADGGAALRGLLRAAADSLRASPKEEKFFRALEATYLTPAATQEQAAERLGLPFSTYRYHLTHGIRRLTDWLWQRELYGPQP
jgi:DNA-binding protein Fis